MPTLSGRQKRQHAAYTERVLTLARQTGDQQTRGVSYWWSGTIAAAQGAWAQARRELHESLAIFRAVNQPSEMVPALSTLAFVEQVDGDPRRAQQHAYEALERATQLGDYVSLSCTLPALVLLMAETGATERAAELWGLARQFPELSNAATFKRLRDAIAGHMATLPPQVAEAAVQRGQSLELWQTAQTLLAEVHQLGWAEDVHTT